MELWGEGAVVDLGEGRYVFALLVRPRGNWQPDVVVREAFKRAGVAPQLKRDNGRDWYRELTGHGKPVELVPREYPTLVAFEDLGEPASVVELASEEDFVAMFGEGYNLSGITLQVTREADIQSKLPVILEWLPEYWGKFSNFWEPCETECRGEGAYQPNAPLGDLLGRLHIIKKPGERGH